MLLDQLDRVGEDRQVDQPQEVELEQSQRLAGVHLELGHGRSTIRRPLQRHDLGQRLPRDDDPGSVRGRVSRHPLQLLGDRDQPVDPVICSDQLAQLRRGLQRAVERDVELVGDRLGDAIRLRVGQPHRTTRVADRGFGAQRPEGDDLRDPVVAVLARDVVDHLVPPRVLKVNVDVRHRHAVRVQESLEGQPVGERIDRGDAQRIGHDRAGGAPPAGGHDPLLPRESREVGHDQEVRRVPHAVDDPELVVEPMAHGIGQAFAVALGQADLARLAEPARGSLAIWHRKVRQAQPIELQAQVDLLGDPQRVVHGVRKLAAEQGAHLRRRLEEELVGVEAHAAGRVDVGVGLDAEQEVVRVVLLGHRVVGVVGGKKRDVLASCKLDELRVQAPLVRHPVVLDLDVEVPVAQDGPIVVGGLLGALLVTLSEAAQDLAREA